MKALIDTHVAGTVTAVQSLISSLHSSLGLSQDSPHGGNSLIPPLKLRFNPWAMWIPSTKFWEL